MKKALLLIVVMVVVVVAAFVVTRKRPPVQTEKTITIRVPDTQFMGIMPLYVAEEKGFFSKWGIALQWIDVKDPGQAGRVFFSDGADFFKGRRGFFFHQFKRRGLGRGRRIFNDKTFKLR